MWYFWFTATLRRSVCPQIRGLWCYVLCFAQESVAAGTVAVSTHFEKNQVERVMIVEYFAHSSAVGSEWTVAGLQGQEGEQMAARRREDGRKQRPHLEGMAYPDDIHRAHVAESQSRGSFPDDSPSNWR